MKNEAPEENAESTQRGGAEDWRHLQTLELEVRGDFAVLLSRINEAEALSLEPRDGTYHITVVSPTESAVLHALTDEQLAMLTEASDTLVHGGITVRGIGIIDGNKREDLREVDKNKKTCFLALDIPSLQEFRASVGLPPKDFHITLGFEGGDIHMRIVGKDEKGKNILRGVEKCADARLDTYLADLPPLSFGGLGGQERQKKG